MDEIVPEPDYVGPLGYCIYCPETDGKMTHEHVVPEALGGRHLLRGSSCEACRAKLNQTIDDPYLSGVMMGPRSTFPITGRKLPNTRDIKVAKVEGEPQEGETHDLKWVKLPVGDWPPMVMFSGIDPPGILCGKDNREGVLMRALRMYVRPGFHQQLAEISAQGLMPMAPEPTYPLARMACKTAHAYAHYVLGPDDFEPLLLDVIQGREDNPLWYFGGGVERGLAAPIAEAGAAYGIRLRYQGGYVIVDLQIFAEYGMPTYQIVAGKRLNFEMHAAARRAVAFGNDRLSKRGRRRRR